MTMLNGHLSLHGVDAERLARSVLEEALRSNGITLDEFRREDLLQDLIVGAWELSRRYDSEQDYALQRGRRPGFDGWATYWLRLRVVDWFRRTEGRTKWVWSNGDFYSRERPALLSLDGGERVLGQPESVRSSLPPSDRMADLRARVVHDRNSCAARDKRTLRQKLLEAA